MSTQRASKSFGNLVRRPLLLLLVLGLVPMQAAAFCGFYVSKADTSLFNEVSKVALVRDGQRTVITMAADFRGDVSEFSMVVPVVDVPLREQINVASPALLEHLDEYTAPRLVEYYDPDPCQRRDFDGVPMSSSQVMRSDIESASPVFVDPRVTIEAEYEVGEYDILILSAKQSDGLISWLNDNGYRIPDGAQEIVGSYLKRGMKFFVARVALDRHSGSSVLRPIQVAYEDENFMLPIRLGTVNADGKQELFVFALTRQGRVETRNYRTRKLPSDMDVPIYIKDEFGDFYRDLFTQQVEESDGRSIFLEYAWDMAWCDPCAAQPLSRSELKSLGVMWLDENDEWGPAQRRVAKPVDVFVTRLHLRYDGTSFPEDLDFQVTGDRQNFQGRYVLRHPWRGDFNQCAAARKYAGGLVSRWDREAETLAKLTGRDLDAIRQRMADAGLSAASLKGVDVPTKTSWWQKLWDRD